MDYKIAINLSRINEGAIKIAFEEESTRDVPNAKLVTRHIVKMISANMFVSEQNLDNINDNDTLRRSKTKCEKEIKNMKLEQPKNLALPFHKILISNNLDQLVAYAWNKNILDAVFSLKYKATFPIYSCVLHNQLKKGVWRKMLIDKLNGLVKK